MLSPCQAAFRNVDLKREAGNVLNPGGLLTQQNEKCSSGSVPAASDAFPPGQNYQPFLLEENTVVTMQTGLRTAAVFLTIMISGAICVDAAVLTGTENANLFGTLDQNAMNNGTNLVDCAETACGPTAATNSFVFLQNMFPGIYKNHDLVPTTNGQNPSAQEQADVANMLGSIYMKSCDPCGTGGNGTFIEDFIFGKNDYINTVAPGTTTFAAQIGIMWRTGAPTENMQPKPAYVQDNTAPTPQFITSEIAAQEDVEIFVGFDTGGAHYLTLTSMTFDTTTNKGTIKFVDPSGGTRGMANITGFSNGFLHTDYSGGASIFSAVAESPIPEPGSMLLLGLGLTGLCLVRRRLK